MLSFRFKYLSTILLILLTMPTLNAQTTKDIKLKTGDLLFRETLSSNLSQAIDQVTQTEKQTHYSHVGMALVGKDSIEVLHASPTGGTCKVPLSQFSNPDGDSTQIAVYRLKEAYHSAIPNAVAKATSLLGKPYNFSYILSDTCHYCSEFIYLVFAEDSIFELNPMTFKNPVSGKFSPTWMKYYQDLGLEIPEGLPGCNPNGMAASPKLTRLGILE